MSNGESWLSMPLIACISGGSDASPPRSIDSPIRRAAGSSTSARLSVFAAIHSARRTTRTSATSVGGSSPVNRATWSSATRTASSNPCTSASVASRSSPDSAAPATATCLASSQFTGPDDDDMTRCISRNNGASRSDSGSMPKGNPKPPLP